MPHRLATVALLALTTACSAGGPAPAESAPPASTPTRLRLSAVLTQDSRDAARERIAVIVANDGEVGVLPEAIEYTDPRLSEPLTAGRLREIPAGGERRFPLPLVDPVCPARPDLPGRLVLRAGPAEAQVEVSDDVGVLERWVQRRCAELEVAAVAALELSGITADPARGTIDLVLSATPTGEGRGAYVIETVGGTPVFTSAGEPWQPRVTVSSTGEPVEVVLTAQPARCDGHVFAESAGATAFLVTLTLDGQSREVLVRMAPERAADALAAAVRACRSS